jgi:hypothetical protein
MVPTSFAHFGALEKHLEKLITNQPLSGVALQSTQVLLNARASALHPRLAHFLSNDSSHAHRDRPERLTCGSTVTDRGVRLSPELLQGFGHVPGALCMADGK